MILTQSMIEFVIEALKRHKANPKEWHMDYDESYNLKYAFYIAKDPTYNIISSYTLYEYGKRVVTFDKSFINNLDKNEVL